jgi:hypothetical protein
LILAETDQPNKGHDEYFAVPVMSHLISIRIGFVLGSALCPGAAKRPQEIMFYKVYLKLEIFFKEQLTFECRSFFGLDQSKHIRLDQKGEVI